MDDGTGLGNVCYAMMTNNLDATLYTYDSSESSHTSWETRASDVGAGSSNTWEAYSSASYWSCNATQIWKTEDGISAGTTFSVTNFDGENGSCTVNGDTSDAGCYCTFGKTSEGYSLLKATAYLTAKASPPSGMSSTCTYEDNP